MIGVIIIYYARAGPRVGHRQQAPGVVLEDEVFIPELGAINRLPPRSVPTLEIASCSFVARKRKAVFLCMYHVYLSVSVCEAVKLWV
jgi:hypothetical protein